MSEIRLSELPVGGCGRVTGLTAHGAMRRRLLDIGLAEGTKVECIGESPMGDPCAYLIRGAVIAIRRADGKDVVIHPLSD